MAQRQQHQQRQQQQQHLLRLFDSSFKASFNASQCLRVLACVCGCVCGRVCLRCNSVSKLKSSEPDEMAFNMQLNLICPNSSSSSCHRSYCSQAAADAVARCTLHACRRTAITTCHCASDSAQQRKRTACSHLNPFHSIQSILNASRLCPCALRECTPLSPSLIEPENQNGT